MECGEPRPYRWSREQYYQACEAGFFLESHVQLIDGEIIEMPVRENAHALGITFTEDALRLAFGPQVWVRVQMSMDLSPRSVPDPDLAVIAGSPRSHVGAQNPTTALLVVEVADTTLSYDRNHKACLYAASGIPEYWILNLVDRQLEVYRDSVPDSSRPFGFRNSQRTDHGPGDHVSPLAQPISQIAIVDLLP
jgi:Uma2 family endonuclease